MRTLYTARRDLSGLESDNIMSSANNIMVCCWQHDTTPWMLGCVLILSARGSINKAKIRWQRAPLPSAIHYQEDNGVHFFSKHTCQRIRIQSRDWWVYLTCKTKSVQNSGQVTPVYAVKSLLCIKGQNLRRIPQFFHQMDEIYHPSGCIRHLASWNETNLVLLH